MKAFPRPNTIHPDDLGMDLRDYFAAKAMQGLLTHDHLYLYDRAEKVGLEDWNDYVVETAYFVADEMIKARK